MNDRTRRLQAIVGVVALIGGALALVSTRGRGAIELRAFLSIAGGVLAAWMVLRRYRSWLPEPPIDPPVVERPSKMPAPGDDIDRTIAQFSRGRRGVNRDRVRVHARVQQLAAAVLARRRGISQNDAMETIEAGEWPSDPLLATFLAESEAAIVRSWTDRILDAVSASPSTFQQRLRRSIDMLAEQSDSLDIDGDSRLVLEADARDEDGSTTVTAATGRRTTDRWQTAVTVGLGFVGIGFLLGEASVVLAGAVPFGFVAYGRLFDDPSLTVSVERDLPDGMVPAGESVDVKTTIRNEGDHRLVDIRIVDGVPAGLSVVDGSPRGGGTVAPGDTLSVRYTLTARRGRHTFDPVSVVSRDYAGRTVQTQLVQASEADDTVVQCETTFETLPVTMALQATASHYLGRIPAERGDGVEFHATREYRPGDSLTRIDWHSLARSSTDDLATIQFREDRAGTVVLVIETDGDAYVAHDQAANSAAERSIEAAGRLFGSLLETGDHVGIATLGPSPLWIEPGTGPEHRQRVETALATDPAVPPRKPDTNTFQARWVEEFHRRFPASTQVVLLSALCSDRYRHVIPRLQAYGHPVTIVSPDPTVESTVGQRLVALERQLRIETLRGAGVRVIDWSPEEELAIAIERAGNRWSS